MIKLTNQEYNSVTKSLEDFVNTLQTKMFKDLDKNTIVDYQDQYLSILANLKQMYLNYYPDMKVQSISDSLTEDILYCFWDTMSDLNNLDNRDEYLENHMAFCASWLLLASKSNQHVKDLFNNDVDSGVVVLSFDFFFKQYKHDLKNMKLEHQYYWQVIKEHGWNNLKIDPKDNKRVCYYHYDKLGNVVTGKVATVN